MSVTLSVDRSQQCAPPRAPRVACLGNGTHRRVGGRHRSVARVRYQAMLYDAGHSGMVAASRGMRSANRRARVRRRDEDEMKAMRCDAMRYDAMRVASVREERKSCLCRH
jgi:hypothetical protein